MLKVTIGDILAGQLGLGKLFKLSEEEKISVKLGYRVTKVIKKVEPEVKSANEAQLALLKKYGTPIMEEVPGEKKEGEEPKMQESGRYDLGENVEVFEKEYDEFLKQELELDVLPLPLSDLEDLKLTVREINSLDPFIEV